MRCVKKKIAELDDIVYSSSYFHRVSVVHATASGSPTDAAHLRCLICIYLNLGGHISSDDGNSSSKEDWPKIAGFHNDYSLIEARTDLTQGKIQSGAWRGDRTRARVDSFLRVNVLPRGCGRQPNQRERERRQQNSEFWHVIFPQGLGRAPQ